MQPNTSLYIGLKMRMCKMNISELIQTKSILVTLALKTKCMGERGLVVLQVDIIHNNILTFNTLYQTGSDW